MQWPTPARRRRSTRSWSCRRGATRSASPARSARSTLARVLIGRYPVANAQLRAFARRPDAPRPPSSPTRSSPTTRRPTSPAPTPRRSARGLGGWPRRRLPTGDEWEALARGADAPRRGRGATTFDEARCNCAEGGWGWTVPVTAHPDGAGPFGAEQLAGNVWEWVADRAPDGWGVVRGGSYLDTGWGLRACRVAARRPRARHRHHRLPHRHRPEREERMTGPPDLHRRAAGGVRPLLR